MSDEDHTEEFQKAEGGSKTFPCEAGSLKKGGYVVIDGHPCKISEISFAKTGKHGHAKASIVAIDIFTNKKYEDSQPSSHNMDCPVVVKTDYPLISCDIDGYCTYSDKGECKSDLKLPDKKDWDWVPKFWEDYKAHKPLVINVVSAMGEDNIVGYKEDKEK